MGLCALEPPTSGAAQSSTFAEPGLVTELDKFAGTLAAQADKRRKQPYYFGALAAWVLLIVCLGLYYYQQTAIAQAMAPTGSLIFKDWVVSASPIHWLCLMSDRYLTGDDVVYCTMGGINTLVADIFGPETIRQVDTVRPWRNNVAVHVTRSQHGMHKASDQDLAIART